jgi:hypothetical protein
MIGRPYGGAGAMGAFYGGINVPGFPGVPQDLRPGIAGPIAVQTSGLSALSFGDPLEETVTNLSPAFTETVSALLPAVSSIISETQDPYRKVELLKVKLSGQAPGSTSYKKTAAKLRAAEARLGLKDEAIESTREWRSLGKAGVVTGIGIGAAIIFLILTKALK